MSKQQKKPSDEDVQRDAHMDAVWEMKRDAWTYRDIAAQLSLSVGVVHKYYHARLAEAQDKRTQEHAADIALENERYDAWTRSLSSRTKFSDPQAIVVALAISKERRKLNGWDAPTRVAHEGKDGGAIAHTVIQREETPEEAFARLTDPVAREAYIERISAVHSAQQHLIELQRQLGLPHQSTAAQVDAGAPPD